MSTGYSNAYYDYKTGEVCLLFWDGDERVAERIPFRWYFYLKKDDYAKVDCPAFDSMVDDLEDDGDHVRIYSSSQWDDRRELVDWLRSREVEPLEADLPPVNRFLTDNPVEFDPHPRLLFYDLESDARAGFGDIPKHRILSVSWCDGADGEVKCIVAKSNNDEGERDLLIRFFTEAVSKADVLVAWNGKFYDDVVIKARAKHHDLYPRWRTVNFLDMMELFKHSYYGYGRDAEGLGVKVSWSLDNIAKTVLGHGKVDIMAEATEVLGSRPGGMAQCVVDMHRAAPDRLVAYNMRDVAVMAELEREKGYVETLTALSHVCNRFLSGWSLSVGYLNDAFVLRYGAERGMRFPTKQHAFTDSKPEKEGKYKGAFVLESEPGLFEGVTTVDFGSLYPNVIDSFNISPEMLLGKDAEWPSAVPSCQAANGAVFRTDVLGVFPAIIRKTKEGRAPYKKKMMELEQAGDEESAEFREAKKYSQVWKLIGVGSYGVLGSPWLRFYSVDCAEAVTLTARHIEENIFLPEARKQGIQPLAGDTDSGILHCWEDRAKEFCDHVHPIIDEYVSGQGGTPGLIRLDTSPSYQRIVFTAKKHYAGIKVTGKMDVKGLEMIKSDGCRYLREMQRRILEYVLEAEVLDPAVAEQVVRVWRDRLFSGEVDVEDLQITQAVNKPLDSYKVDGVHVRIAREMLRDGREVHEGAKIPYIVTRERNGKQQGVHADDFDGKYDAHLYWDKVWPATRRVLEAAFRDWPWKRLNRHNPAQRRMFK